MFINSENSKTSSLHRLLLNLIDKKTCEELKKVCCLIKSLHLLYVEKHKKLKLKYQLQGRMINLNYQMDHILYQIFN